METMAALDAKFLYSETPTAHMHTIKVAVSDVSADQIGFSYDNLTEVLRHLLVRLPAFRRRIVPVPGGLDHPVWVEDPEFELGRHLTRLVLADPGNDHQLADAVAAFASTPLLRDRPLWELLVLEGLARERVAVVVKIHHAVADGTAAVAMLRNAVQGVAGMVVRRAHRRSMAFRATTHEATVALDGRTRPRQPLERPTPPGASGRSHRPVPPSAAAEPSRPGHRSRSITSPRHPSISPSRPNGPLP